MKAIQTSMLHFMQQQNQQFIIPVYQRTYKWSRLHCKQLWQDILRASGNGNKTHFIGSVVYITDEHYQATKVQQLTIIDGQQRITTISLLLMAMCNYLDENPNTFRTTSTQLFNQYLINQFQNKHEDGYIKLQLTKHDKEFFDKLIRKENTPQGIHNIYTNYKYFYEQIKSENINIDELYDGIAKLMVVDVSLVRAQDDPQLIFESLNSTGAKLTQADLIRNFLLMDLNTAFQSRIYNDYWFRIETTLKEENHELSNFIRDYLTIKIGKIPNKASVYDEFKKFFRGNYSRSEENIEQLNMELLSYSLYYNKIIRQLEENQDINRYLTNLERLDVKVVHPFLMKLYNRYDKGLLSYKEFAYVAQLIESFIIRRLICGLPTNSLSKVVISLIKDSKDQDFVKSVEKILTSKKGVQRFPNDDEFREKFVIKDVYNLNNKSRRFLLDMLENFESKEILNVDEFTIEHIMPQTLNLSDKWVKALGNNWRETHNKYLHTIGNLTLTRFNSEMGNKFFTEKRDMVGGYRDSACRLNKDLKSLDTWNENEIIKRAIWIVDSALKIWNYPTIKNTDENYNLILDFDDDWTGKSPKYFTFMDEKHIIKDITHLYIRIITIVYEYDPDIFLDVIKGEDFKNKRFFSDKSSDFRSYYPLIDEKLFINTNMNSETKKRNIWLLLDKMGFSEDDFVIYLEEN